MTPSTSSSELPEGPSLKQLIPRVDDATDVDIVEAVGAGTPIDVNPPRVVEVLCRRFR
jgi:hypothetical protein